MKSREFRPAPEPPSYIGKCPNPLCKRVNTMVWTGKFAQNGDRVYQCGACRTLIGAPSDYAECDLFDEPICKDVFWSPCSKCPNRRSVPGHGVCIHFKKKEYKDLDIADEIEQRMKRFRVP